MCGQVTGPAEASRSGGGVGFEAYRRSVVRGSRLRPRLRPPGRQAHRHRPLWPVFPQVSVAEDARFELARGCPQHAFQHCWPAFASDRRRS